MRNLFCAIFGHKYRVKRKITHDIRELKCTRCKLEFGIHHATQEILPLDDELIVVHEMLMHIELIKEKPLT